MQKMKPERTHSTIHGVNLLYCFGVLAQQATQPLTGEIEEYHYDVKGVNISTKKFT